MPLKHKDFLGLRGVPGEEIDEILNTSELMKHILLQNHKKTPHLQGKSIVTLFYENSTRTRLSFELAGKYMSASASNVTASSSSVSKGETLIDTGKTIEMMGTDVLIIRHPLSGAPHHLAKHLKSSVINAGDGTNEHPTQALLDMFTIKSKKGRLQGVKVAIVGDILHSRVARSNIWGLNTMGAEIRVAAPPTLIPIGLDSMGVKVCRYIDQALEGADVVMALRLQKERQQRGLIPSLREYATLYGINKKRLALADKEAIVMHPGPMNRGVEINTDVADAEISVINEQVTNGVAVRMALLYLITRRRGQ